MVRKHWQDIFWWFISSVSNGVLDVINGLIQAAKARTLDYHSNRNLIAMTYLVAGKLRIDLPT